MIDKDDNYTQHADNTGVNTDKNTSSEVRKESTRTYIALTYIIAFFAIIVIVLIICTIKDFPVSGFKDMLITVSGVLSGPLGFIVGYYFKASRG